MSWVAKSIIGIAFVVGSADLLFSQDFRGDFEPLNVYDGKDARDLIESIRS
jgi:hypothetical protein